MRTPGYVEIERNAARSLKQLWDNATVLADVATAADGVSSNYLDFRLKHPENNETYNVFLIENPFRAPLVSRNLNISQEWSIGPYIELSDLGIEDIFPVLYKYYDGHPIGGMTIRNTGDAPIESLRVDLHID